MQRTGRKRPHSLDRNLHVAERFILPFLAHLQLNEIGKPELSLWMEKLSRMRKADGSAYSLQTFGSAWSLLQTMFNDAESLIGFEVRAHHKLRFSVKAPKTTTPKDTLTREELVALLEQTQHETPDIRTMIWVSATTGMRFGELAGLEWRDFDLENLVIHIRRSQVGGKMIPTKTSTERTVPLYPNVAEMVIEHRKWLRKMRIGMRDKVVFPSRNGKYRAPAVLKRPLARCAQKAGLEKHVTNQTLRRTVNNLIRQAAGEIAARAVTGHTTQSMTEHYSDVNVTATEKRNAGALAFGGSLTGSNSAGKSRKKTPRNGVFQDISDPLCWG
ncbi:MAG: site-specific integrase [Deltaproteobacteria bacterium]|nr:site-specific integrase [Deltaproteobacteria bacterium]